MCTDCNLYCSRQTLLLPPSHKRQTQQKTQTHLFYSREMFEFFAFIISHLFQLLLLLLFFVFVSLFLLVVLHVRHLSSCFIRRRLQRSSYFAQLQTYDTLEIAKHRHEKNNNKKKTFVTLISRAIRTRNTRKRFTPICSFLLLGGCCYGFFCCCLMGSRERMCRQLWLARASNWIRFFHLTRRFRTAI